MEMSGQFRTSATYHQGTEPKAQWTENLVDPSTCLQMVVNKKIPTLAWKWNLVVKLLAYSLYWLSYHGSGIGGMTLHNAGM
jgi:hypothetical protein